MMYFGVYIGVPPMLGSDLSSFGPRLNLMEHVASYSEVLEWFRVWDLGSRI